MPLQPQRFNIPIAGGLSQDETPEYLDPPALYVCDNFYHKTKSSLIKRNGYDSVSIVVDSRQQARPIPMPLLGANDAPIDRFIDTESSVTFAAKGRLWTYAPEAFTEAYNVVPRPNTIRHNEIPDLQIRRESVATMSNPRQSTNNLGTIASVSTMIGCASAVGFDGTRCDTWVQTNNLNYEWWVRIVDTESGVVVSEQMLNNFAYTKVHPCVAAFPDGFIVTVGNPTDNILYLQRYLFADATWTPLTFPTLTWTQPGHDPQTVTPWFYDMYSTGSNVLCFAVLVPQVFIFSAGDFISVPDALLIFTLDALSISVTHGLFLVGDHAIHPLDCFGGLTPIFSVAGTSSNTCAAVWYSYTDHKTYFRSSTGDTLNAVVDLVSGNPVSKVGLCPIVTKNGWDVAWNAMYEKIDGVLTAGGITRYTTYSVTLSSAFAQVTTPRAYFSTQLASNPWCINGCAYALLVPDTLYSTTSSKYAWGDVPWVVTRTFSDSDALDFAQQYKPHQFPHAVWGYGTTLLDMQPYRVHPDVSDSSRKASGSVVLSDPFSHLGQSIEAIEFDPTGPDRYQSAPLPGGGAIFGCAQPWIFDGELAFEAAFVTRPVLLRTSQEVDTRPLSSDTWALQQDANADDFHYFKLIYEHIDNKGRVTRSPVSPVYMVKIAAAFTRISLVVSGLWWTSRGINSVIVNVYMCRDNENFAFAGSAVVYSPYAATYAQDPVIQIAQYPTDVAPLIYTTDGELESGYPQLASKLVRWNNRIWLGDSNEISYSHAFVDGDQVSFPDILSESIDHEVTALSPLDDRVLCFAEQAILYRSGEGPAPNGVGSSYNNWTFITHEIGCANSRSVFHSLAGVYFQSKRGVELMGADGSIVHQRSVEDYFATGTHNAPGDTVMGTLSLPRDHQARLLYRDHTDNYLKQLVFDYGTGTWSRWYASDYVSWGAEHYRYACDVTEVDNTVYLGDAHGNLLIESDGRLFDQLMDANDGTSSHRYHIDWAISSPWIKGEGLQGFQRVWRTTVMFRCTSWLSPAYVGAPAAKHGITSSVSVDYGRVSEDHPAKLIDDLQDFRDPNTGLTQLTLGHKYQQCSAYQLNLSSAESVQWNPVVDVSGVTEILGIWSEFGIEPGTGHGRKEGKI